MITVANRIFVNPAYAELFEEHFHTRAGLVDTMPGFIRNQILRPTKPDDPYIVLTLWETRAHFDAWVQSDEFRQGHARTRKLPRETFSAPNKLEVHEVIQDSSRPASAPDPHSTTQAVHDITHNSTAS